MGKKFFRYFYGTKFLLREGDLFILNEPGNKLFQDGDDIDLSVPGEGSPASRGFVINPIDSLIQRWNSEFVQGRNEATNGDKV